MPRYPRLSAEFHRSVRKELAKKMPENSLLLMFANKNHPSNADAYYPYVRNSHFFYLTGIQEPGIALIMKKGRNGRLKETLLIPEITEWRKVWDGEVLDRERSIRLSGAETVEYSHKLVSLLKDHVESNTTLFYPARTTVKDPVLYPEARSKALFRRYFRDNKTQGILEWINELRLVKKPEEIEMIRQAIRLTQLGLESMRPHIKAGVAEYELEAHLLSSFIGKGSRGFAFEPIIASGINSCTLHYVQNNSLLKKGQVLLVDVGAELGGYHADITRVYPVGKWSSNGKRVYDAVARVLVESRSYYKPGTTIVEINRSVADLIEGELIQLGLITRQEVKNQDSKKPAYRKYFMHSAAHFLGLDVHDVGDKKTELQPGMVLTLEPGIYVPEWEVGVRLEDDILITETGCEVLSNGVGL